ncbi:MAG TPA: hypothetical protein VFS15_12970 [Kofleriaceae bacterium]|nr:hypothetical protein [Kofleriaceae bacterium]
MTRLVALALVAQLGACEEAPEMFPVTPGGPGTTGTSNQPDAAIDASDASTTISARVCLLLSDTDVQPRSCALTSAGGLTVALGTETAITNDDGTFTIMRPADTTGLVWRISGTNVFPSAVEFGTVLSLPVISAPAYQDMLAATDAAIANGDGALFVRVVRGAVAVAGAVVSVNPPPTNDQIFYDGADPNIWETTATGILGVAWVPSEIPGTAQLTVTTGTSATVVTGIPVFQDTITFATAEIP